MPQLGLFGDIEPPQPKLARKSDPDTSQESAADIVSKLDGLKASVMQAALDLSKPATASELAEWAQGSASEPAKVESYRKRVRELERDGLLKESGKRPCRVSGKNCNTFEVIR